MNEEILTEILKYSSPDELFVVGWDSRLYVLNCPFKVQVIASVGLFKSGEILRVEKVKVTKNLVVVYLIDSQAYYYHYFDIILE